MRATASVRSMALVYTDRAGQWMSVLWVELEYAHPLEDYADRSVAVCRERGALRQRHRRSSSRASARRARPTPAAAAIAVETTPVASIKQIMIGITNPAAFVVYEAVGTKSTAAGDRGDCATDRRGVGEGRQRGGAVVESGNLMLMGSRAIDKGDWVKMTRDMMEQGKAAMKAADAKRHGRRSSTAGGDLNATCDNCHARYHRE